MANTSQHFRQHQITRVLKAAKAAGMKDPHVKVHLPNGTVLHVGGGGEVPEAPPKKPARAAGRKRPVSSGGAARPARGGSTGP